MPTAGFYYEHLVTNSESPTDLAEQIDVAFSSPNNQLGQEIDSIIPSILGVD